MGNVLKGAAQGAAVGSVVPGLGTVAGGIGGGIIGLFGSDDDDAPAEPRLHPGQQLRTEMNGRPTWGQNGGIMNAQGNDVIPGTTGAELDAARYRSMGEAAMGRGAPSVDYQAADASNRAAGTAYGSSRSAIRYGTGADRDAQMAALALQHNAALGNAPSRAELYGRSMLDQSLQAQLAGAASARGGPMAQAAAGRQAAIGAAAQQQQGVGQLAALRAQEMEAARGAYSTAATGVRTGDYQGADAWMRTGAGFADLGARQAQQSQYQNDLVMRQRALNDLAQQNYEGLGFNTNNAQLQAQLGNKTSEQAKDMADAANRTQLEGAVIGAAATTGAALARAGGGPVKAGHPYVVGERGPELIVPSHGGTVIPNHQLAAVAAQITPQQRAHYDNLARQADAYMAGHQVALADGPAVRRLASGTPQNGYETGLTRGSEAAFRGKYGNADTTDYDLRGAHAAGLTDGQAYVLDADSNGVAFPGHLPDTFKKPNHETFSDESQYAAYALGAAGHWSGDIYVPGAAPAPAPAPTLGQVALMGGRDDPYTGGPPALMGGREDPYGVPGREEGGPVNAGKVYVVGEGGPEVIVPRTDLTKPVDLGEVDDWAETKALKQAAYAKEHPHLAPIRAALMSYADYASPAAFLARDQRFEAAHPTLANIARRYRGQAPLAPPPTAQDLEIQRLNEKLAVAQKAAEIVSARGAGQQAPTMGQVAIMRAP